MTFQQLSYIAEIAKCGSINKAAQKLFLSQSGISTAVRELEEELGVRFFVRSNRGVEFTPEGKEFLSYALSLLEQKQRIESLYGESRNLSAPARFSVSTQRYPFSEDAFLKMLQSVDDNRYQYTIKETGMDAVIDDVYDHRADVGVIFLTELTEKMIRRLLASRELEFHEIASVPPCVYARRDHPLTELETVTAADLAGYPYVSFEHEWGVAADFSEEYQIIALKKPSKRIAVNNRSTMMNILARTDAFTTGSGLLVEKLTAWPVVTIPLAGACPIRLGWIHPRNAKPSARTEQFAALLEQSVMESIRFTQGMQRTLFQQA